MNGTWGWTDRIPNFEVHRGRGCALEAWSRNETPSDEQGEETQNGCRVKHLLMFNGKFRIED